jgi:hypothetical protein
MGGAFYCEPLGGEELNAHFALFSPNDHHSLLLALVRNREVKLRGGERRSREYEACAVWRNVSHQTFDLAALPMITNLAAQVGFVAVVASPFLHVGLLSLPGIGKWCMDR